MAEVVSELERGQKEVWEGLAKVFDGARNEVVKLPGGHELKHGEVWAALAGAAFVGAGVLLGLDPTKQELDHYVYKFIGANRAERPEVLDFLRDIIHDKSIARTWSNGGVSYGVWEQGPAISHEDTLQGVLGLGGAEIQKLSKELAKMEMHRQFRNITSWALIGAGFISGVLVVTDQKAKEKVVWSDTIGPLLARGIRAMNNVSERP